jgi:hypothetical protein
MRKIENLLHKKLCLNLAWSFDGRVEIFSKKLPDAYVSSDKKLSKVGFQVLSVESRLSNKTNFLESPAHSVERA